MAGLLCRGAFAVVAATLLFRLVAIWRARLLHPFDLEWMEGAMLIHVWRMQRGLPIYVEPSLDFIPFVYPPGYAALIALLAGVFGLDYAVARVVSLVSTGLAAAAIAFLVVRGTRSGLAAAVGAFVFLGCYASSGLFYDLARVDALALALLAWSIALAIEKGPAAGIVSALLLSAAAVVKLQSVVFGLPLMLGIWRRDGLGVALRYAAVAALPACSFAAWMQWETQGLFLRWLIVAPASHGLVWNRLLPGTPAELGAQLPVVMIVLAGFGCWKARSAIGAERRSRFDALCLVTALLAGATGAWLPVHYELSAVYAALGTAASALLVLALGGLLVAHRRRVTALPASSVFAGGVLAVALLSSAFSRAHFGGFVNVLMPAHWALALGFSLVLARLPRRWPRVGVAAVCALASLQLGLQLYDLDPERRVPSPSDRESAEKLVEALRARPGPVLSPFAPWLPVQAGHPPSLHMLGISENSLPGSAFAETRGLFEAAVAEAHWPTVVAGSREIGYGLEERYQFDAFVEASGRALWPRSGYVVRPETIMVPRP